MDKKPLYRKVNKITHNGWGWYVYPKCRYRFDKEPDGTIRRQPVKKKSGNLRVGYDYTPLCRFLHAHVGQQWLPLFQECQSRLNDIKPLMRMVVNVNERGLVVDRNPDGNMEKYCFMGEMSAWSTLYVDEVGLLQFVDKDYVKTDENPYPEQTFTFNGIPVNSEYVEMRGN